MDNEFHLSQKPFGQISSSIGPLSLFEITSAGQAALCRELGKRIDQCGPEEYVRRLARYICFPAEPVKLKDAPPAGPVFTMSEIEDLSETDLEVFSTLYIQNHPSLYRKFESERAKDKDGSPVISWKLGDILYPKEDDESFTRYLHRLTGLRQAREIEQAEKQAARERERAAAAAAPVSPPSPAPEPERTERSARRVSRLLIGLGIGLTLISLCSLAASLSALALARRRPPPARELPADINLNINVELARIAELLNSLRQAQETGGTASAEHFMPPEERVSPVPPAAPRDEAPPADIAPILEELRKDCAVPRPANCLYEA